MPMFWFELNNNIIKETNQGGNYNSTIIAPKNRETRKEALKNDIEKMKKNIPIDSILISHCEKQLSFWDYTIKEGDFEEIKNNRLIALESKESPTGYRLISTTSIEISTIFYTAGQQEVNFVSLIKNLEEELESLYKDHSDAVRELKQSINKESVERVLSGEATRSGHKLMEYWKWTTFKLELTWT